MITLADVEAAAEAHAGRVMRTPALAKRRGVARRPAPRWC